MHCALCMHRPSNVRSFTSITMVAFREWMREFPPCFQPTSAAGVVIQTRPSSLSRLPRLKTNLQRKQTRKAAPQEVAWENRVMCAAMELNWRALVTLKRWSQRNEKRMTFSRFLSITSEVTIIYGRTTWNVCLSYNHAKLIVSITLGRLRIGFIYSRVRLSLTLKDTLK